MSEESTESGNSSIIKSLQRRLFSDYHRLMQSIHEALERDYEEVLVDIKKDLVDLKDLRHKHIESVYNKSPGLSAKLDPNDANYRQAKSEFTEEARQINERLIIHVEQLQKDKGVIEGRVREAAHKFRQIIIDNSYLDKQAAELLVLLHRIREGVFSLDAPESDVNKAIGLLNSEFDFTSDEKKAVEKADEILKKLDKEL